MSQALYRKYRSTSFDELVGQEHVTELLKSAVKNGTFSHAYLFTGQRGTGKTSAARILAYAINELPYDADAGHLDIIEIDAASNRRIDDIRDLREKVFIAPVSAKYKVYIIDEVHMLTGESFNALLKTIEEPPAHAVFILATTELHKVPATIVSRTQRFHFRPVSFQKVVEHLRMIATKEQIDIDDEALQLIAEHGGGSFRDSISLLDQLGSLEGKVTANTVESILGRARSTDIATVLQLLHEGNQTQLHALLNSLLAQGISPVTLSEQLVATLLHESEASTQSYELSERLMSVPKAHFPQLLLMTTLLGSIAKPDETASKTSSKNEHAEKQATRVSDASTSFSEDSALSERAEGDTKSQIEPSDSKEKVSGKRASEDGKKKQIKSATNKHLTRNSEENDDGSKQTTTPSEKREFNWEAVLAATKKTNSALHSVLSRAEIRLEGNDLHLGFQYALHRKKLEQAEYRAQLMRIILDVCGLSVELHIETAGQQLASDDHAKKVADLMGGGERVTV